MRCSKCGLENPAKAEWCDCGFVFAKGEMDAALPLPKRRSVWRHPVVIGLCVLAALTVLYFGSMMALMLYIAARGGLK